MLFKPPPLHKAASDADDTSKEEGSPASSANAAPAMPTGPARKPASGGFSLNLSREPSGPAPRPPSGSGLADSLSRSLSSPSGSHPAAPGSDAHLSAMPPGSGGLASGLSDMLSKSSGAFPRASVSVAKPPQRVAESPEPDAPAQGGAGNSLLASLQTGPNKLKRSLTLFPTPSGPRDISAMSASLMHTGAVADRPIAAAHADAEEEIEEVDVGEDLASLASAATAAAATTSADSGGGVAALLQQALPVSEPAPTDADVGIPPPPSSAAFEVAGDVPLGEAPPAEVGAPLVAETLDPPRDHHAASGELSDDGDDIDIDDEGDDASDIDVADDDAPVVPAAPVAPVVAAAAVAVTPAAVAPIPAPRPTPVFPQPTTEDKPKRSMIPLLGGLAVVLAAVAAFLVMSGPSDPPPETDSTKVANSDAPDPDPEPKKAEPAPTKAEAASASEPAEASAGAATEPAPDPDLPDETGDSDSAGDDADAAGDAGDEGDSSDEGADDSGDGSSSTKKRWTKRKDPDPQPAEEPKPKPVDKPKPKPVEEPKPQPKTASQLAVDAKKALAGGNARLALTLANQSLAKQRTNTALEVKALAACKLNSKATAKNAAKDLPRDAKKRVKQKCKDMGVRLGLI